MKYALLIYSREDQAAWDAMPEAERNAIYGEYMTISNASNTLGGEELQASDTATVVRVNDGERLTTDGPFAETKEVLGGFFLVEAADLDAALDVAAKIPAARMGGAVEVRPIVEM
jgi:hypothetical protein